MGIEDIYEKYGIKPNGDVWAINNQDAVKEIVELALEYSHIKKITDKCKKIGQVIAQVNKLTDLRIHPEDVIKILDGT